MDSATAAPVRTAASRSQDPEDAAKELARTLKHEELGFVLFFCSAEYPLEALGRALETAFCGMS